jgi:hypothetical protein
VRTVVTPAGTRHLFEPVAVNLTMQSEPEVVTTTPLLLSTVCVQAPEPAVAALARSEFAEAISVVVNSVKIKRKRVGTLSLRITNATCLPRFCFITRTCDCFGLTLPRANVI